MVDGIGGTINHIPKKRPPYSGSLSIKGQKGGPSET